MRIALIFGALVVLYGATPEQQSGHSYVPPNGFVPDSATAVRIAVAVWMPIYGSRQIASQRPFVARLEDSVWTVTGTLPPGHVGGTALARIGKRDGRILSVTHGR